MRKRIPPVQWLLRLSIGMVALPCILPGCAEPAGLPPPAPPTMGPPPVLSVSGTVKDADTKAPIGRVVVCCHASRTDDRFDHAGCAHQRLTDAGGHYEISVQKQGGRLYITATTPGYRPLKNLGVAYYAESRVVQDLELVPLDPRRLREERPMVRWTDHPPPRPRRGTAVVKVASGTLPVAEAVMTRPVKKGSRIVIGVPAVPPSDDTGKVFRTTGYFNRTEQALELGLMRKGLQVVDRVVFEAELKRAAAAGGKEAPPLSDAGELFRLAKDSDLGADYLLQINAFNVAVGDDIQIDVRSQDTYQELASSFPQAELPRAVTLPGRFASLSAKLIDIKTGTIASNVDCRADMRHVADSAADFEIVVDETFADTRTPSRAALEARLGEIDLTWTRARAELVDAYDSGGRGSIVRAESAFDEVDRRYRDLASAATGYEPRWTARHTVRVIPPASLAPPDDDARQDLESKLSEITARALIDSIEVVAADAEPAPARAEINRNKELTERLQAELGIDYLNRSLWYADQFYHTVIDKPDLDLVDFPPLERPNARFPELLLQEARRYYLQYLARRDVLPRFAWMENRRYSFPFVNPTPENWFEVEDPSAETKITVIYEFEVKDAKLEMFREVRSSRGNVMERSRMFSSEESTGAAGMWDGKEHALMEVSEPSEHTKIDEPYGSIVQPGKGAAELFEFIRRGNY